MRFSRALVLACSGAASTRVANELGSGRPLRAARAAHTSMVIVTALMVCIVAVGIALCDVWGYLFTNDPEVRPLCYREIDKLLFAGSLVGPRRCRTHLPHHAKPCVLVVSHSCLTLSVLTAAT